MYMGKHFPQLFSYFKSFFSVHTLTPSEVLVHDGKVASFSTTPPLLERGREGRNTSISFPSRVPQLGTLPRTQACSLTGNPTSDFQFAGPHSIHWATPARTILFYFILFYFILFEDFIYLILERGERMRETHQWVAFCTPLAGNLTGSPRMCPNWESNLQPFNSQAGT